jgi:hypothetical protein
MQPLDDEELTNLLQQWTAPATPATLERRVLAGAPRSATKGRLGWLTTGWIRVPVPVGIAVVLAMILLVTQVVRGRASPAASTLSDFQPVKELKPRLIRN